MLLRTSQPLVPKKVDQLHYRSEDMQGKAIVAKLQRSAERIVGCLSKPGLSALQNHDLTPIDGDHVSCREASFKQGMKQ